MPGVTCIYSFKITAEDDYPEYKTDWNSFEFDYDRSKQDKAIDAFRLHENTDSLFVEDDDMSIQPNIETDDEDNFSYSDQSDISVINETFPQRLTAAKQDGDDKTKLELGLTNMLCELISWFLNI